MTGMTDAAERERLWTGALLMVTITLFWGINWPAMKLALNEIPPLTFRVMCLAVGGPGLLLVGKLSGHSLRIPRGMWGPLLFVAFFSMSLWHIFSAIGIAMIQAGRASIIGYTMPIWATALGAVVLHESIGGRKLAGIALGMAGLGLLLVPGLSAVASSPFGALMMTLAAVSWAVGTVAMKYWQWGMPVSVLVGWQGVFGAIPVVIGWLLVDPSISLGDVSARAWAGAIYAMLIPMIYCHWAYYKTVMMFPANIAALSTLATPVVGVVSSALLLGEPLGLLEFGSMGLVTLALVIILAPLRSARG